jgi:hypothetical protein
MSLSLSNLILSANRVSILHLTLESHIAYSVHSKRVTLEYYLSLFQNLRESAELGLSIGVLAMASLGCFSPVS